MKNFSFILSLSFLLQMAGCGDLFKKDVVTKPLNSSQLRADCELNMDRFSLILKELITQDINCLEKNLDIFMNVSEIGRGGRLNRVSLVNYLKRNRPEMDPKTYTVIKSVFDLANLITGEQKDFISRKNVKRIIELVRVFNAYSYRHFHHTFGSKNPANLVLHESHRHRVEEAAKEIEKAVLEIYVPDRGSSVHYLNILELIEGFIKDPEDLEKIEGILFVKKIILGGDVNTLTHVELGHLFDNFPKLLSLVLDVVRFQYLEISQEETLKLVKDDVVDIANVLFHPNRGDRRFEGLFEVDYTIESIDKFIDDPEKKISKFKSLITEVVKILTKSRNEIATETTLATNEHWVTGKDLQRILDHAYNGSSRGLIFHEIYQSPKVRYLMNLPQSVQIKPEDLLIDFPNNTADVKEFSKIVNNYRYMKGSEKMSHYGLNFKRNPNAVAEIGIFEYGVKTFFSYYGSSLSMDDKQLRQIMKKFESELVEVGIILPRRSRNTAETISLLGSLFQSQSDDNKVLDVNEATEFIITLMTGIDAQKKMFEKYQTLNCETEQVGDLIRIEPNCFRDNFYTIMCDQYRDNLPRLFEFLGQNPNATCEQNFNTKHNIDYLNTAFKAARTCHVYPDDNTEIWYSEGDIMSIVVAMLHIETTITRWDTNLNNTMDPKEVLDAWAIYKPAIIGMLPPALQKLPPKLSETLAKLVYQYLVKFEEAPQLEGKAVWKTIANLTKLLAKKGTAHRKNIAAILKVVSDESKKKAVAEYEANPNDPMVEKPFDCNWMRDPDNIPRD